jgi:signal transduction histidine kinase
VAEWPKNDAFLVVNEVRNQVFYLTFAALVIVLFLGWLVGRRILKPLKILQTGAEKIGEGNFDLKLKIETGDELQNFAQVLNNSAVALKRLKELREEFVFIASHELRTPVTAMKGYLSMVLGGEAGVISPDAKKMLEQVTLANQRLVQLVEDLLEVARSDAGRLTINTQKIEMSPIVQNVLKELMPLAKEKNIQLVYAPSLEAQVLADPERLKEVLVNLVGNAIKYTVGSGTVTINHQLKGKELITSVSDTGIGMTASEQQNCLKNFTA